MTKPKINCATMEIIRLEKDISAFLNKVEREVIRIFDFYGLPYKPIEDLGMLNRGKVLEIFEQSKAKKIPYPWDLHQASGTLRIIEDAKTQLSHHDCQGLAFNIGSIVQIVASGSKVKSRRAGRSNLGRKRPLSLFLIDVIKSTRRQNSDFTSTDAINNIQYYYEDNSDQYWPELDILEVSDEGIKYSIHGEWRKPIKRKSLAENINNLRKEIKK